MLTKDTLLADTYTNAVITNASIMPTPGVLVWSSPYDSAPCRNLMRYGHIANLVESCRYGKLKYFGHYVAIMMEWMSDE